LASFHGQAEHQKHLKKKKKSKSKAMTTHVFFVISNGKKHPSTFSLTTNSVKVAGATSTFIGTTRRISSQPLSTGS
jgi:hypothetical protein